MAASYEWVPHGCPRRSPSLTRVHTVGTQLRQAGYQQASECMTSASEACCVRDFEVASSAHDVLSAHHDRGFEDIDLFFSAMFKDHMMPLVVMELNPTNHPPRSRALVFSYSMDFHLNRAMVLVCGIITHDCCCPPQRPLRPSGRKCRISRTLWLYLVGADGRSPVVVTRLGFNWC